MVKIVCRGREIIFGRSPLVMGILNVTPDSFSDGGKFLCTDVAIKHGKFLAECGADIIDVGGESTRPFATSISADEELCRIIPVIKKLSDLITVPISVDTTKASVASHALSAGASIVNDISALSFDSGMAEVVSRFGAGLVLMHIKGSPKDMQIAPTYDGDLIEEIKVFLSGAIRVAVSAGISKSSIILDPGLGFGKTGGHNFEILKRLGELRDFGFPVMVGSSRKSFIRKRLEKMEITSFTPTLDMIEIGTQAAIAVATINGANIVRVHDVSSTVATLSVVDAVKSA